MLLSELSCNERKKLAGLSFRQEAVNVLPSKVCTTINEDGENGLVCWEGKKKGNRGRRRLLECGRSGWGKTPGPAVDFHPP